MRLFARVFVSAALVALWLPALAGQAGAAQFTFANAAAINMAAAGAAIPYPSNISVSGITGQVGDVDVTLTNMSHTFEEDVNVLLVGPGAQKVLLVSDVGGSGDFVNTNLTLSDGAAALTCSPSNIASGTYRPTDCPDGSGNDLFPAPAPAGPYGSSLSAYNGVIPNGTWSLYVYDDTTGDTGNIAGGWSLKLTTIPDISVSDATVAEGDSGSVNATFTISLSEPAVVPITVDFVTSDGTATSPSDYQGRSGTRIFFAGQSTKTVSIAVKGDTLQEGDELFFLQLVDPDGAVISDGLGVGTIQDNDAPAISINDVSMTEGGSGATKTYRFKVTLDKAGTNTVTVHYATADGTAVAPIDYATKFGNLSFSPGTLSKTVSITVKGDNNAEPDEVFYVNLSAPTNATIADPQGVGTIIDND